MKASDWSRISPISVLYFFIRNINQALNLWPALAGALAIPATREWVFEIGVAGFGLLILAAALINYWFFSFHFDDEKIQIRQGLMFKKNLTLYFERVQEANLEQALYFRPFNLWTLQLESAGGKEAVSLPGVSHQLASKIKQLVLDAKKNPAIKQQEALDQSTVNPSTAAVKTHSEAIEYQIKLNPVDLLRYGLMHNTLIYYVAILAPILGQNEKIWIYISEKLGDSWLVTKLLDYLSSHNLWLGIVAVTLVVLLILAVVYVISILLAMIKYWDYSLNVQNGRYQFHAGLINRMASGFRKHKLQTLIIKQSLIARLLKRYSVYVRQTNEAVRKQGEINLGFIIPVVTEEQLQDILQQLNIRKVEWKRCSPMKILWDSLIWGTLICGSVAIFALFSEVPMYWVLVLAILIVLLSIKNWYSIGYEINHEGYAVKQGILGINTTYVPQIKIQKLQIAQGPIQRLHKTASVTIWSGATLERLNFIPAEKLQSETNHILQTIARFRGRWM